MPQIINTNVPSLTAQRNLTTSQGQLATALQRLSSGLRINSARDDAAGLAIADRFTAQIRGLNQAARNANDGISLAQTAEGALNEVGNNLQRLRELAVQSANATNSATDRVALQAEAAQLIAEIDRVASTTKFNGVALLDGSFTNQQFQVGADANQTISITAINSARVTTLGSTTTNSTTVAGGGVTANILSAGDLVLNGVSIQGTVAGAAGQTTDSAFAKAAAINAQSALSFVTATAATTAASGTAAAQTVTPATTSSTTAATGPAAATTTVSGGVITAFGTPAEDITAGDIEINGTAIGAITGGADAAGQATNVAAAINLLTGTHGVTATVYGAGLDQIRLTNATTAAISVDLGVVDSSSTLANTGLTNGTNQLANTYSAITGTNFTVGGNAVTFAGGVYASSTLATDALVTATNTALTGLGFTVANSGGNLALSRVDGANFTVTAANAATQAVTGFGATITTTNGVAASSTITAISSGDLSINGVAITTVIAATTSASQRGTDLAAAINSQQASTGVTATAAASGALTLSAADGRNITVAFSGTADANNTGLTATTTRSTLTLSSTDSAGITITGNASGNAGFTDGLNPSTATTTGGLSLLSIATVVGSNTAIATVDAALATVNSTRADLGAYQNRFASTVANLTTTSENLSASRSRILDADFAAETAALTRGQILQQAGVAILAQANSLPQQVLALLR